jgi:5,10-methylenetetrahydromethanopterin reductase
MRIGMIGGRLEESLAELIDDASRARSDGMSSYWLSPNATVDALTAIAVIGRSVPDLELGAILDPAALRHPTLLANQALTVQQAVDGRLLLNISPRLPRTGQSSSRYVGEQPFTHTLRVVTVLRQLLNGGARGRIDAKAPAPPITISGFRRGMLNFAGESADGVITWLVGHKTLANYVVPRVKQAAARALRPAPRVMSAVAVCVTDDAASAVDAARTTLGDFGAMATYRSMLDREGVMEPHDLMVAGDEDEVREGLLQFGEAGATDLLAVELCPDAKSARRTRRLLSSIIQAQG